jgi:hypothetical protein
LCVLRRIILPVLVVFVLVSAVSAVADALVVTETERLGDLAGIFASEEPGRRVDELLRYVAPEREALEVTADGRHYVFADGQEVEAADTLRAALDFADRPAVESVQESVTLEADTPVVALRLRANGELHDLTLYLSRHDDRWLARRIVIR